MTLFSQRMLRIFGPDHQLIEGSRYLEREFENNISGIGKMDGHGLNLKMEGCRVSREINNNNNHYRIKVMLINGYRMMEALIKERLL